MIRTPSPDHKLTDRQARIALLTKGYYDVEAGSDAKRSRHGIWSPSRILATEALATQDIPPDQIGDDIILSILTGTAARLRGPEVFSQLAYQLQRVREPTYTPPGFDYEDPFEYIAGQLWSLIDTSKCVYNMPPTWLSEKRREQCWWENDKYHILPHPELKPVEHAEADLRLEPS